MGPKINHLAVRLFSGDYPGAVGQIYVTMGRCYVCDRQPVHVMHMDASDDTFDNGSICLWCIEGMFVIASKRSVAGPAKGPDYMQQKTPRAVPAVMQGPSRVRPPPIPPGPPTSPPMARDHSDFATHKPTDPFVSPDGKLVCSQCCKEVAELWIDGTCMDCTTPNIPMIPTEIKSDGK